MIRVGEQTGDGIRVSGDWEALGTASLTFAWQGSVTPVGFSVVTEPTATASVSITVATNSEFSDVVHTNDAQASPGSPARFDVTGLDPNTRYYWRVSTDSDTLEGQCRTYPTEGQAASVVIATGSCAGNSGAEYDISNNNTSNAPTFDRIRERDPTVFVHMGDLHYKDVTSSELEPHRQAIRDVLANPRQGQLYRDVPFAYVWDDHEWGPNDSHAGSDGRDAALAVYPDYAPFYPLTTDAGLYQDWKIGRVRNILLDVRSFRDPQNTSNDSDMLGSVQKALLLSALQDMAENPESQAVLVLYVIVPWISDERTDTWFGYSDERAEIAQAIEDAGLTGRTIIAAGDMHGLAIDDGSNNTYAAEWPPGPVVFQAAPFDCSNSTKGGPYSEGTVTDSRQQYGVIEIADDGQSDIEYTLRGFSLDSNGEETETITYSAVIEAAFVLQITSITTGGQAGIVIPGQQTELVLSSDIGAVPGTVQIIAGEFTLSATVDTWDDAADTVTVTLPNEPIRFGEGATLRVTLDDTTEATTTVDVQTPEDWSFFNGDSVDASDTNSIFLNVAEGDRPAGAWQAHVDDPLGANPTIDSSGVVTGVDSDAQFSVRFIDLVTGDVSEWANLSVTLLNPQGLLTVDSHTVDGSTVTGTLAYTEDDAIRFGYRIGSGSLVELADGVLDFTITDLPEGQSTITFVSINDAGEGDDTAVLEVTVEADQPEPEPQGLGYLTATSIDLFPSTGSATLLTGTDMIVRLSGLKDEDDTLINDGTVNMWVRKRGSLEEITGQQWPLEMTPSGEGDYTAGISRGLSISDGNALTITVVASYDGRQATFNKRVRAAKQLFR